MGRPKSETLTDSELRVMKVVWETGGATVAEIRKALSRHRLAYTTILTTIQVLEQKGHVTHTVRGRAFVYAPRVGKMESRRGAIRQLLTKWFDGSPNDLILNLVEEHDLTPEALNELMKLARRKKRS